jgi:hypothetical protein
MVPFHQPLPDLVPDSQEMSEDTVQARCKEVYSMPKNSNVLGELSR